MGIKTWKNSVTLWANAVQYAPTNPLFNANLAVALLNGGFRKEACDIFKYCTKLTKNVDNLYLIRSIYTNHGNCIAEKDPQQAEKLYKNILEIDPSFYTARYNLVQLLIDEKKNKEALQEAQALVQIFPTKPNAWALLANAFHLTGNSIETKKAYTKSMELQTQYRR